MTYRCNFPKEKNDKYHCQVHADLCDYLKQQQHKYDKYFSDIKSIGNDLLNVLIKAIYPNLKNEPDSKAVERRLQRLIKQYMVDNAEIKTADSANLESKRQKLLNKMRGQYNNRPPIERLLAFLASVMASQVRHRRLTQCFFAQPDYGHVKAQAIDSIVYLFLWSHYKDCGINFENPPLKDVDAVFSEISENYTELNF